MNSNVPQIPNFLYAILLIWGLIWKGLALWKAAKNDQKYWFIVMLIINTVGILELIYLFRFAKKRLTFKELQFWKKTA
jgi:hypothetical protein